MSTTPSSFLNLTLSDRQSLLKTLVDLSTATRKVSELEGEVNILRQQNTELRRAKEQLEKAIQTTAETDAKANTSAHDDIESLKALCRQSAATARYHYERTLEAVRLKDEAAVDILKKDAIIENLTERLRLIQEQSSIRQRATEKTQGKARSMNYSSCEMWAQTHSKEAHTVDTAVGPDEETLIIEDDMVQKKERNPPPQPEEKRGCSSALLSHTEEECDDPVDATLRFLRMFGK